MASHTFKTYIFNLDGFPFAKSRAAVVKKEIKKGLRFLEKKKLYGNDLHSSQTEMNNKKAHISAREFFTLTIGI